MATDAFGDPIIDYFGKPYSDYLAANSFIGADPLVAAVPTDASGNPLIPFNTIGAAVSGLPTGVVGDVQAVETDVFGNPFDSTYSISEKDAPANSPSFQDFSEAALANAQSQVETINATEFTNSTDSTFITIPDIDNQYALLANDETGNLEIAVTGKGSRFIAESGLVCLLHPSHNPFFPGHLSIRTVYIVHFIADSSTCRSSAIVLDTSTSTQMSWQSTVSLASVCQTNPKSR